MSFATDRVTSLLHSAFDGLILRQRVVIACNSADLDTPSFRATSGDFKSWRTTIAGGSIADACVRGTAA